MGKSIESYWTYWVYTKMRLDREYFDLEFEGEVGLFEAYLNDMEGFLSSEITRLKEEVEDAIIVDNELVNTEFQVVGHYFPNILRKSFLVSLYSFLEHWLLLYSLHLLISQKLLALPYC